MRCGSDRTGKNVVWLYDLAYPLDILGGAGIGMTAGGVILLALGTLLRRAGPAANGQDAATEVRSPRAGPEPNCGQ